MNDDNSWENIDIGTYNYCILGNYAENIYKFITENSNSTNLTNLKYDISDSKNNHVIDYGGVIARISIIDNIILEKRIKTIESIKEKQHENTYNFNVKYTYNMVCISNICDVPIELTLVKCSQIKKKKSTKVEMSKNFGKSKLSTTTNTITNSYAIYGIIPNTNIDENIVYIINNLISKLSIVCLYKKIENSIEKNSDDTLYIININDVNKKTRILLRSNKNKILFECNLMFCEGTKLVETFDSYTF